MGDPHTEGGHDMCDCCGKTREAGDDYPQADGRMFCGNCDGDEQPGCPNCNEPAFFGILSTAG